MSSESNTKSNLVDPSALGLMGLAMVTLVASYAKFNPDQGVSYVIPWVIFLGAFAQLYASIIDSKKNNPFGTTVFGAYAFFWFGVGTSWLMKLGVFGEGVQSAIEPTQLGVAFIGYLVFSLYMTIAAVETNKVLLIIMVLIDILLASLACTTLGFMKELTHLIAAYTELAISIMSFYASAANALNNQFGRIFLPVGKPLGIFKK